LRGFLPRKLFFGCDSCAIVSEKSAFQEFDRSRSPVVLPPAKVGTHHHAMALPESLRDK
jgi:hypothetical protein